MGWMHFGADDDDWSTEHEGYFVGVVKDGYHWRELGYGDVETPNLGLMIQVACECGWRSHRMTPPLGCSWRPCSVDFDLDTESYEDAGIEMWRKHIDDLPDRHYVMTRGRELQKQLGRLP